VRVVHLPTAFVQDCAGLAMLAHQWVNLVVAKVQSLGPVRVRAYAVDELHDELLQG
jgi:hypothetical protein